MVWLEERELLRRLRRGDPSALEELMDRDMGFACGLAGSVLRGRPRDAEEVVSDAFLALWEHGGTGQAPPLAGPGGAQQGPQPPAGAGR